MSTAAAVHVVFAGGGTGGHLFPGLAVAEQLCREMPQARVTFAGSGRELERRHVADAGFGYLALRCRPLPRRPWHLPRFLADNVAGYLAARRFIRQHNVDAVIGLGGFASVPMAQAAVRMRLPLLLLEQNAVPGRATRWLAPSAAVVCLALESSRGYFAGRCRLRVTGNPVRAGFARCPVAAPVPVLAGLGHDCRPDFAASLGHTPRRPQLLILGGSGGAQSLNENVPRALAHLGSRLAGWSVVHQSGQSHWQSTRRLYQQLGVAAKVVPFVVDMPGMLAASDLAVCRAGGTTLAELAAAGLPAVLLPYPRAADDHQRQNAEVYATAGGCLVLDESEAAGRVDQRLAETLSTLLPNARLRKAMSRGINRLARPRAADEVVNIIRRLLGKG